MDLDVKKQIVASCKPEEPIPPADPRHYDFDREHLRGQPWREWLANEIRFASEPRAQLVTGLKGSGKTTELKQLQEILSAEDYNVIMADVGAWLSDDEPLSSEDLMLAMILSVYPGGPDGGSGWLREYTQRAWKLLNSEVQVEGGVDGVKARLTTDDTLFQRVARSLRKREGLREEVFELLGRAADASRREGRELVLILDGAEKRATGESFVGERRAEFHNKWFGAFILQGRDLRPPIHTIYTVPPFMIRRSAELHAAFGCELLFLPMVRVFARGGGLHEPGVRAVTEALKLRVPLEYFEDPTILTYLVGHSGGYMRDLLRFVNVMVHNVHEAPRFRRVDAEFAVRKVRRSYIQGLVREEKRVLERLHPSKDFPDDEASLGRMDALLQGFKMFRYHNDDEWYDAHALFWELLGFDPPITWAQAEALTGG